MNRGPQTPCYVQKITTAVPPLFIRREQTEQILSETCVNARSARLLKRIVRLTGIEKRHLAILDFQTSLEDAGGIYRATPSQPLGPGMGFLDTQ